MTLRDLRDEINDALEEGFGGHEMEDGFTFWDYFKEECGADYDEKRRFVQKLSKVLNIAKPHLTCEFFLGEELNPQRDGEFVIATAQNGYQYRIDVTASSLASIGEMVFRTMIGK